MEKKTAYSVTVFGFNQTEKVVLGSIFGLSARRAPKFEAASAADRESPDIFLVDADDPAAIEEFQKYNADRSHPAILIGSKDHGLSWPVLARPLQWTRLFKAFDLAVESAPIPVGTAARVAPASPQPAPSATPTGLSMPTQDAPTLRQPTLQSAFPNSIAAPAPGSPAVTHPRPTQAESAVPAPAAQAHGPAAFTGTLAVLSEPRPPQQPAADVAALDWALVVDDNATVREFMRTKLAPFKINVDFAASGEEAIGMTANRHYSCVFLDVVMPGMDGYQVCKLLKAKKHVRKTAVVMLTSKGSPFDRIRGTMAGCDTYLTKPVDEDRLLETIAKYLPHG
jgi:twitching motility two-component system response regulator PilG